jgi:hypothetical protein
MENIVTSDPQSIEPTRFVSGGISFQTPPPQTQPNKHRYRSNRSGGTFATPNTVFFFFFFFFC